MKDVLKRKENAEDQKELQGSTLDLGYETSYHNSGLDLSDEKNEVAKNGKTNGKLATGKHSKTLGEPLTIR